MLENMGYKYNAIALHPQGMSALWRS